MMAGLDARTTFRPLQALGSMVTPVGDVIRGPKQWFSGEVPGAPVLGPMAGRGGGNNAGGISLYGNRSMRGTGLEPSPGDSAQTDYPQLPASIGGGPDFRMPLQQKQAAEANTLNQLGAGNDDFAKQWSEWGRSVGMDPAQAVRMATKLRVLGEQKGLGHLPDNAIKFQITLMRQKGEL